MQYRTFQALHDVSISLQSGKIYGFIGENGAGKTTLMRIIAGLAMQTKGELILFGEKTSQGLLKARKHMSSIIEHPALYPSYTVEMNLQVQQKLVNNPDAGTIERVLRMVGLWEARGKKAKNLSTGMKQRLGIALSLMGNPKLLILDEPMNGLDPRGVADFRAILKHLHEELKITIFISSHMLNELYSLATDYIIIHAGRIVKTFSHDDLNEKSLEKYYFDAVGGCS